MNEHLRWLASKLLYSVGLIVSVIGICVSTDVIRWGLDAFLQGTPCFPLASALLTTFVLFVLGPFMFGLSFIIAAISSDRVVPWIHFFWRPADEESLEGDNPARRRCTE